MEEGAVLLESWAMGAAPNGLLLEPDVLLGPEGIARAVGAKEVTALGEAAVMMAVEGGRNRFNSIRFHIMCLHLSAGEVARALQSLRRKEAIWFTREKGWQADSGYEDYPKNDC